MFLYSALVKRKRVKSLIFFHVGDDVKCTYMPRHSHTHTHNQSEAEIRVQEAEAFNFAAVSDIYLTIRARCVSKVKSVFDVKSSNVLLMPVSSLAS